MTGILVLGFLIGMRHALDADHVAAVAALATRSSSLMHTVMQGTVWGIGHTLTLFLCAFLVLLLNISMPEALTHGLECAVGVMLLFLGFFVFKRLVNKNYKTNNRQASPLHYGIQSDTARPERLSLSKDHIRALLVGSLHGMAGSAALILITLETIKSTAIGLLYITIFGIGSIVGMAILSVIIAIALRCTGERITSLHIGFHVLIGMCTMVLGVVLIYEHAPDLIL